MKDRMEMSEMAKTKRNANRADNLAHADKVFVRGTWYEGGVGNPRRALSPDSIARRYARFIRDIR